LERLAKYYRGRKIFDGKLYEVYERASDLLKDTPFASQIQKLYIAVNIVDILMTKPADLMVGEPPSYESGLPDSSVQQKRLNSIVEENDLNQLIHEIVIGSGIRGESFIKPYYSYRQDFSDLPAIPSGVKPEPIIEAINPMYVFPELSRGSSKKFKAINIAYVEWEFSRKEGEVPYLNVERHIPGYIVYSRYRLQANGVDNTYGAPIELFTLLEQVATGRERDVVPTGVPQILVQHVPYKTLDDDWKGIGGIEKLESVLAAINDRLVQIDYILWKHSDPIAYGPDIDQTPDGGVRFGGKYIPVSKEDVTPGYMTWTAQLDSAFKELDILLGIVFQMSETPQWLFGTTMAEDKGGSGTSHTDGAAIQMRLMPILSKVKRIRVHVDRAIRDALYIAMQLENYANEGVDGFEPYEPIYPKINWRDGIPKDEKLEAEVFQIRTGNKPTIDVRSAIKRMDGVDDEKADEVIRRIDDDETRVNGTVDSSIFNGGGGGAN